MKKTSSVHGNGSSRRPSGVFAFCFSLFAVILLSASAGAAKPVTLSWDPSPDVDLAAYRIYQSDTPGAFSFGSSSHNLVATVPAGAISCELNVSGGVKYFVGTAVDIHGNESLPSNEVSWVADGWSDYRFSLRFRSDDSDGAIGAMFRYRDHQNYYRFSWNVETGVRRLLKRERGVFKVLAEDTVPYVPRRIYDLDIAANGADITVFVDGAIVFTETDVPSRGSVALYSWKNNRSYFAEPEVSDLRTGDVLLAGDFTGGPGPEWKLVDEGTDGGDMSWSSFKYALFQSSDTHTPPGGKKDVGELGTYAIYYPDTDGDSLPDYMESVYGSDPAVFDSDGDGLSDGEEAWWNSDPADAFSVPAPREWTDYTFEADFGSTDDDAIGVMFRYRDSGNYYRFSWSREDGYRRIEKALNGSFYLLYEEHLPYEVRTKYHLAITVAGDSIVVRVDGAAIYAGRDSSHTRGGVALYSAGSKGACFDNVRVDESAGGVVLEEDFNDKMANGWRIDDQGLTSYPSNWIYRKGLYVQYSDIDTPAAFPFDISRLGTYSFYAGN